MHALHHREDVMGTVVTIDVYTADGQPVPNLDRRLTAAIAVLHDADEIFSIWNPGSVMSQLRRGEISRSEAPPDVDEVLRRCAAAREITSGWFDPWAMPGGIDPTGYVKGWAAQRALEALGPADDAGTVPGAIVNAAGDIASCGGLGLGMPFRFGITDPFAPRSLATVVALTGAIATSGTYERGAHLTDPHTGRAAARTASASVTGPDLGLADALATALAVAGEKGLAFIEPLDGYEAFVIRHDRSRRWTDGFPFASDRP